MSTRRPFSPSLAALMGAAAALSPAAHAQSDGASTGDSRVSYRYNDYSEDGFAPRPVIGDPGRYHVDSQQFLLDTGVGGNAALDVTATHEIMSGSSPWYTIPGPNNRPIQVLSGATIRDHRSALQAAYVVGAGTSTSTTFSASSSVERDYRARALGVERSVPLSNMLTLGFGGSFSHDTIEPTDALLYDRVQRGEKNTTSAFASLAWVIDKTSVVQTGIQVNVENGYLSDPYKLVSVGEDLLADTRPGSRTEAAWLLRYRHAYTHPNAALHVDYRYAQDSWGVASHTLDVSWYQQLGDGWQLVPSARYYTQQQARFYAPFFIDSSAHQFFSSDYRLGTFGAFSTSINLRKRIGHWEFSAGVERYHGATDYALGGADLAVPAVISYTRALIGLDYVFN